MKFNDNKILVTGGAGYIGSHIVEILVRKKFNVVILDNLSTGNKKLINTKAKFIKGDIQNFEQLRNLIKSENIKTIIHLAASLNISEAEKKKKKYYENNVNGTFNVIKSCYKSSVRNLIFSSSCSIYGPVKGKVSENKRPNPISYYAKTKLIGEKLIIKNSKKYNYKYGILRYFNVAGASRSGRIGEIESSHGHLIKNISKQSLKKKPKINIFGKNHKTKDGTCIRDYIHVSDLAEIHFKILKYLMNNKDSLTLNCGYGKGYSVLEIVNTFRKIKKDVLIKYKDKRNGDVDQVFACTKKLNKIFKWKPKNQSINNILKSSIKWEKKLKYN